jgi:hypothetical protein
MNSNKRHFELKLSISFQSLFTGYSQGLKQPLSNILRSSFMARLDLPLILF